MSTASIGGRRIGDAEPAFIVAEMSANHDGDLDQALRLVESAAAAGVDALKLQTYTPDSLSLRTSHPSARVDPIWGAETLYDLYAKAAMPYEFHAPLFARARELGLIAFSSPFDEAGVDFLERFDVPAYKVASPEIVHLPLLRCIGQTGKPVVLATGMSDLGEVEEALQALVGAGATQIVLLHCCSVYPADPSTVNLRAMDTLRRAFGRPVGFSDHTLGIAVPIAAVALGACMIEKHFTDDVTRAGPDHRFSLPADDLKRMVEGIRQAEAALGDDRKVVAAAEAGNRAVARRSLFAAEAIPAGTTITEAMLRVVRPGAGLHPRELAVVVGRVARRDIPAGWPITWDDV
jgi:pseudaminic acid synthase